MTVQPAVFDTKPRSELAAHHLSETLAAQKEDFFLISPSEDYFITTQQPKQFSSTASSFPQGCPRHSNVST